MKKEVARSHDAPGQRDSVCATVYRSLSPALELGVNANVKRSEM
jgi:hypothetical protein